MTVRIRLSAPYMEIWSCDPEDIPSWTEEDKKRLNEALAKAFGWKETVDHKIDKENELREKEKDENALLIDPVAKAIFRSRVMQDPQMMAYYEQHVAENKLEEFVKILDQAVETTWNGTEYEDEMEKARFRTDAIYALKAAGLEVNIDPQIHKTPLV